ncbi:hypothetical protein FOTG_00388 [Fusarium oxysporum f. sp. vasinfectum 25433]|uniref:Uncharacterized protein n=1 Tax=Fusarium oxysporum f. sp. vasinfectum 25433 TaxID=1089449 RepID=X0NTP1_FUSOX|nr:hypothetical protein FOTG_00388 [Fusarium oxysporum f. sp. vasinfectum 25433]
MAFTNSPPVFPSSHLKTLSYVPPVSISDVEATVPTLFRSWNNCSLSTTPSSCIWYHPFPLLPHPQHSVLYRRSVRSRTLTSTTAFIARRVQRRQAVTLSVARHQVVARLSTIMTC